METVRRIVMTTARLRSTPDKKMAMAISLGPIVAFLQRRLRLPQALAVGATFLLGLILLAGLSLLVTVSFANLSSNADAYQTHIEELIERAGQILPLEDVGLNQEALTDAIGSPKRPFVAIHDRPALHDASPEPR